MVRRMVQPLRLQLSLSLELVIAGYGRVSGEGEMVAAETMGGWSEGPPLYLEAGAVSGAGPIGRRLASPTATSMKARSLGWDWLRLGK